MLHGHTARAEWLQRSQGWTPLHHLEVLSTERMRAPLRGGADVHDRPTAGDMRTPAERAAAMEPPSAVSQMLLRAQRESLEPR
jgi:hypothetical protein